jgi:lipoyl(octanoyl) transferase
MPSSIDFRWLGRLPYDAALRLQHDLVEARRAGTTGDTVLLLEHEPVYTIGRTPDKSSLRDDTEALPHPVVEISRGGQATYHGPGQLVGYPVLDLQQHGRDLHRYLRALEEALITLCASLGVPASRRDGMTGVWVGPRKLASIGVGVRHWVSLHGFAINITPESLAGFNAIVPCGLAGVEMTCLATEAAAPELTVEKAATLVQASLRAALAGLREELTQAPAR